MPTERVTEEEVPAEDYSSWETAPSDPEIEDPLQPLYALVEQDLGRGHVRETS